MLLHSDLDLEMVVGDFALVCGMVAESACSHPWRHCSFRYGGESSKTSERVLYILTNVVIVFIFHGVILYHLRKRLRSSCCRRRGRLSIGALSVGIGGFNLVGSDDEENVRTQRVDRDDADVPRAVNSSLGTYRSGEDGLDQEGQMLIHLSNWSTFEGSQ